MITSRYQLMTWHSEGYSAFYVVDTIQPEDEQPAVVVSWNTKDEPNARYLAMNFCDRHNVAR